MKAALPKEEELFRAALALGAGVARDAFLEQACAGRPELRARLDALIAAHDSAGSFLEPPAGAAPAADETLRVSMGAEESLGTMIGRYKLLEKIGEGGFGMVYVAEQREPVKRRVALKIIKLGMDTRQVVARFEAERQALALMDHPNIAKVLDAGATETGRPYFVMELVRGIKITDYCDQNNLPTHERLDLFQKVCHAIQHAHQKGIIHRDIKPSNILVTLHDGVAVPKVIDFGIAKATQGDLTDKTVYTQLQQFIGTPAYMSPEQAEMSGLDMDTRSDIYSLGVLLYELLTGRTPFDAQELMKSGVDAMRKTIREKEPLRPSTRLNTLQGDDLTTTARRHGSDAPRLINALRGDLDWIVMKCLEKDRTRRYDTSSGLALDIQRYLSNEPVLARPPTRFYRLQKLVRRNKPIFAAIMVSVTALMAGLALSLYLFVRERAERQRAVAAEREQARLRQQAEFQAALGQKLTYAGVLMSRGQIDDAERLVGEAPLMPSLASFFTVFGSLHARRGQWAQAVTNFTKVVELLPSDYMARVYLSPLLLQMGNLEGYEQHRQRILDDFPEPSDPMMAERLAKACLITQPRSNEMPKIMKFVDTAVAAGPKSDIWEYIQFGKGLAELRRGQFATAIQWLESVAVENKSWVPPSVQAFMALSMAQYGLKQFDEARASFAKGEKIFEKGRDSLNAGGLGDGWHEWIIARLLIAEAKKILEDAPKPLDQSNPR
jgi:serine/threonine protein kinase/tetratricopeptide (TPR) repeat protein